MKLFSKAITRVKHATGKRLFVLFMFFLALSVSAIVGASSFTSKADAAGDWSNNAIMPGGASSCAQFISKIQQNTAQAAQWRKIYAWNYGESGYGLQPTEYTRFATSCQHGVAYSNNTIVVGGRTVATSVWSIGRLKSYQGSNPMTVPIPNTGTYYGNYNSQAFASGTTAIPVDVLFSPTTGKLQFAVMTNTCGNPAIGHPTSPTYVCRALNATRSTQNPNQWSFTTNASAGNGATITKLVYNYGDGSKPDVTTNPATAVTHTFTRSSTVTVSVYVALPGGGQIVLTNCTKPITFVPPAPVFTCNELALQPGAIEQSTGNQVYVLRATATMKNGTITSYVFNFGDNSPNATVPTNIAAGNTPVSFSVSKSHTYAPGTWAASVKVFGKDLAGRSIVAPANVNCAKQVTVERPECKPGVPQNDNRCYDYTCNLLTIDAGNNDNRTVTLTNFNASTSNPNAKLTSIVVNWGDDTNATYTSIADLIGKTHQYAADVTSSTITAIAHFTVNNPSGDFPASGENCAKPVSYTTPVPPTPPTPPAPTQLVNTGAGSVLGIFGVTAVIAALTHRIFLGRRLSRQG